MTVAGLIAVLVILTSVSAWAITWSTKRAMPTARSHLSAASASNNKLYAIGGSPAAGATRNTAYSPGSNSWATKAPMPTPRQDLAVVGVGPTIYAIGGYNPFTGLPLGTVEAYNTSSNTWTTKAPMPTPREALAAVSVGNTIYVIGGWNTVVGDPIALATVEAYDTTTNSWSTKASMPTARYSLAAAVDGTKIYAIDGVDSTTSTVSAVEAYDPTANSWTSVAPLPGGGFEGLAAVTLNGKIYAIGGDDVDFVPHNQVESYNPGTNTWTAQAPMPTARGFLAGALLGTHVYAIGGENGIFPFTPLSTVQRF